MSEPLGNWEELQSQWQSYEPDIQKIKKKNDWVTWRMGFILFLDVLVLVTYFPFLWVLKNDPDVSSIEMGWHILMGGFIFYGVYIDFKIRLPIFRAQGETTKDVLELYLNRLTAGAQLAKITEIFCWVVLACFWLMILAVHLFEPAHNDITEVGILIFVNLWILGFVLVARWYKKKKRKEHEDLAALWQEHID